MTRTILMPGIALNHVRTAQFKTNVLTAYFLRPLDSSEASLNALIPLVLRRGNEKHPDLRAMSNALADLYGATLSAIVLKRGEWQSFGLASGFIEGNLHGAGELFCDTLFKPVLGSFIAQERGNLINRIRAQKNDKSAYALQRLDALACHGEPYAVNRFGDEETANLITDSLFEAHYRNMLCTSRIELFYCGNAEAGDVESIFMPYLNEIARDFSDSTAFQKYQAPLTPKDFTDFEDVTQAKLALLWRTGTFNTLPELLSAYTAVMLYGGLSGKLFEHVRERLSLCYYADAQLDRYKCVMKARSGVEFSKIDMARDEMLSQWNAVVSGDFTDDDLLHAKAAMQNAWVSASDSPTGLESFWQGQATAGLTDSLDDWADALKSIDKSDVLHAAKQFVLDSTYCMRAE